MKNLTSKQSHSILLGLVLLIPIITTIVVSYEIYNTELGEKSKAMEIYNKNKDQLIAELYRGQEICTRINKVNDTNVNCDITDEESKQLAIDLCKPFNNQEYCDAVVTDAYRTFERQVRESKANGTYKVTSSKDLEFLDHMEKIPKAPDWVKERTNR